MRRLKQGIFPTLNPFLSLSHGCIESSLKVPGYSVNMAMVGKYRTPVEENDYCPKIDPHTIGSSSEVRKIVQFSYNFSRFTI